MSRFDSGSLVRAFTAILLAVMISACSTNLLEPDPRFARLVSELDGARYGNQTASVNSRAWVEAINRGLEHGHALFYSSSEDRWVLASRDVQFDLFSFSQLNADEVRARLSLPGREGSDSGGNTSANEVHAKVRADAEPIRRLFRSGDIDDERRLRLPMRESSDAIKAAKLLRYLITSQAAPD